MKRKGLLFYILIAGAVLGGAQTLNPSRYQEITLSQFEKWKQGLPREGTDPVLFKARALFEEVSDTVISFTDPGGQTSIYFTVDKTWPEMEEGQPVTIYFSASGSWSWNRVLDEIDRGPALAAQDIGADDPYDGDTAPDQDQYDQDRYDQIGYDEEAEPDEFETPDQGQDQPPVRPAVSVKFTGARPRPGRVYRLQVGAYKVEKNAARTFERLKDAGFSPNYERRGQYLRVVLSGVGAADVRVYTERIGRAGFNEVWCREER